MEYAVFVVVKQERRNRGPKEKPPALLQILSQPLHLPSQPVPSMPSFYLMYQTLPV